MRTPLGLLLCAGLVLSATASPARAEAPRKGLGLSATTIPAELTRQVLDKTGSSWYYTWSVNRIQGAPQEYIPMAIAAPQGAAASELARTSGAPALLGYNEPDLGWNGPGQKVTVEEALSPSGWVNITRDLPSTISLGSPAMAMNGGEASSWLPRFMAGNPRVDFVAVHWYGAPDLSAFKSTIRAIHARYGKPIWLTEFGLMDLDATGANPADAATFASYGATIAVKGSNASPNRYTIDEARSFMRGALAWLEGDGKRYVKRYAWFTPDPRSVNPAVAPDLLWYIASDGSVHLTRLGEIYSRADR